jgi:short subunit dehydrogenase-like uncharacterized protein
MTRTVALLGATGYTGRLVAAELARRGVPHRLGGRSKQRLESVPSGAERHVIDLHDDTSLDAFCDGADALITCIGPFVRFGLPVLEAAVRTGTPYVDSTGEPEFLRDVYARFASAATPVVPACGFDYLPGDLAASVAVEELGGTAEQVRVLYAVHDTALSRGTARSALAAMNGLSVRPRRIALEGPDGSVSGVEVPWGELLTVPLHVPDATVRTGLATPRLVSRAADALAPAVPVAAPLARSLAGLATPLLDRLIDRMPEGPPPQQRARAHGLVLAEASTGRRTARVAVRYRDVYGLTARLLVRAALTVTGAGAMAPAQALPARAFLDDVTGADEHGTLTWGVL